jgi:hypothetical protein
VLEGALERGLKVDPRRTAKAFEGFSHEHATGAAHRNGAAWNLLVPRRRPFPAGVRVHASVRERMSATDYRPPLPTDAAWVDDDWATLKHG